MKSNGNEATMRRVGITAVMALTASMSAGGSAVGQPEQTPPKTKQVTNDAPKKIGHVSQLFFDDYMILNQRGLVRKAQPGKKRSKPVMMPERPWEHSYREGIGKRVYALGTVLYDPLQKQYRMWYMGRMSSQHPHKIPELEMPGPNVNGDLTLYATSKDGIQWERPNLGLCHFNGDKNNNIILDLHGFSVFLDSNEPDPQRRYKAIGYCRRLHDVKRCFSPDGIHWSELQHAFKRPHEGPIGTCYVPRLGLYVAGVHIRSTNPEHVFLSRANRTAGKRVIDIRVTEDKDLGNWDLASTLYPDSKDHPNTQFYGLTPFDYGDIIIGFLHVFHCTGPGPLTDEGVIEVQLAYSRDGRHWHRLEDRRPVVPTGPKGSHDSGMIIKSCGGTCLHNDEIGLYYSGCITTHGAVIKGRLATISKATWKRDRLVAMEADAREGVLETPLIEAPQGDLEVNVDAEGGYLVVEVLGQDKKVIPGFSSENCQLIVGDDLRHKVTWNGADFSKINRPIRLRFLMKYAKLYAFQIR